MSKIEAVKKFLEGKKTYTALVLLMLYFAGAKARFWTLDWEVVAALTGLAIAALRAAVAGATGKEAKQEQTEGGVSGGTPLPLSSVREELEAIKRKGQP